MKRNVTKGLLTAACLGVGLLTAGNAMAAVDMFIKIGTIKGESAVKGHEKEIDVLAWSWGASSGTGRTRKGLVPAACIQDLSFTKYLDSATPELILDAVSGKIEPTAKLTVRKAGEASIDFLVLEMTNVTVVSYQTGGSGGEDRLTENVTLHFDVLTGFYRTQNSDGQPGPPIPFQIAGGGACP